MAERKEDFVLVTKNPDKARYVRSAVNNTFNHIWTCVWRFGEEYKVSVATNWDGSLPASELTKIKDFVRAVTKGDGEDSSPSNSIPKVKN